MLGDHAPLFPHEIHRAEATAWRIEAHRGDERRYVGRADDAEHLAAMIRALESAMRGWDLTASPITSPRLVPDTQTPERRGHGTARRSGSTTTVPTVPTVPKETP